jgi:hypothetical protein
MSDGIIFNNNGITRLLGIRRPYVSAVSSLALVLTSFFYMYTISSYLKIGMYILDNRVTYPNFFADYIVNKFVDHGVIEFGITIWFFLSFRGKVRFFIAVGYGGIALIGLLANLSTITEIITLISLPLVFFFLIYNKFASKKILYISSDLVVNYVAIICTVIGAASILMSLPPIFSSLSSFPVRNYAYDIFSIFSIFSPILMLLLILCLPLKTIIKAINERILKIKYSNNTAADIFTSVVRRNKILYLLLFVLLSMILVLIPHQPAINKDDQRIGVDTTYYVNWLGNLTSTNNTQDFLRQAFVVQSGGDRPLALMVFFTLVKVINVDSFHAIEYLPIILGPLLILAVYFLTRELTSSDITSILAAFLTSISFQVLIGIYAGFYANLLALIIGYVSSIFLIRFLRESQKISYILYSALMIILLLTHVYTWSILAIVFTVFLAVMLVTKYYRRRNIILLLLVIVLSVAIDVSRTALTGSTSGLIKDLEIADTGAGIELFSQRWTTLTETIHVYVGGQFSNFIILLLPFFSQPGFCPFFLVIGQHRPECSMIFHFRYRQQLL